MSEFDRLGDLPSAEAFIATDTYLAGLGVDIAQAADRPVVGAYANFLMRLEQSKLDGTFGEEPEGGNQWLQ